MLRTPFFCAFRMAWYSLVWTRVPTPSLEKTSASKPSSSRPSIMEPRHGHPFCAAGELVINALQDTRRVGHQGVAARAAQVGGGQAFEDLVRHPVRGGHGQLERGRVGDPGPVEVGGRLPRLVRQA